MPPKYIFGYWWSRYWAYTDDEFIALGREFRERKLPIDVMIIDMDWHETWPEAARRTRDDHGEGLGWTGYTWNQDLIGDPEGFLGEVHSMHLKTALNLHPAVGIIPREKDYPAFVADYLASKTALRIICGNLALKRKTPRRTEGRARKKLRNQRRKPIPS